MTSCLQVRSDNRLHLLTPEISVFSGFKVEEFQEYLEGFSAFFGDRDLDGSMTMCWGLGWEYANEAVLDFLHRLLPEHPLVDYGVYGVGLGAWRHIAVENGILARLEAECIPVHHMQA